MFDSGYESLNVWFCYTAFYDSSEADKGSYTSLLRNFGYAPIGQYVNGDVKVLFINFKSCDACHLWWHFVTEYSIQIFIFFS